MSLSILRDIIIPELLSESGKNYSLKEKYNLLMELKDNRSEYIFFQNSLLDPLSWHITPNDILYLRGAGTNNKNPRLRDEARSRAMFVATYVPLNMYNFDEFLYNTLTDGWYGAYNKIIYRLSHNKANITYDTFIQRLSTAVFPIIKNQKLNILRDLLQDGLDPNIKMGRTSLLFESIRDFAQYNPRDSTHPEYIEFIELLLQYGAKVDDLSLEMAIKLNNKIILDMIQTQY